jgi:ATP-binding cassette subfamily B protein
MAAVADGKRAADGRSVVKPEEDYVWPSMRAAEEALLLHAGSPAVEKLVVRLMPLGELSRGLAGHAPAVVEIVQTGEAVAVPVAGRALSRHGGLSSASWKKVRALWEDPARAREGRILDRLPVDKRAAKKVIQQRISTQLVARVTHYAAAPGGPFAEQLRAAGWWKRLAAAVTAHGLGYAAGLTAWALMGRAALSGRWDAGWFWGWVILLGILVPLEASAAWWQGWLSISFGGLLKQRLLAGSLEIDTDKIRHQGVGQLLSRVLESESLEALSLTGGAAAVLSTVELMLAAVVMALGAGPAVTVALFVAWLAVVSAVAWRYAQRRREWMRQRNRLTHDLVEKMNGHRTRIAQQPPVLWHEGEDRDLVRYLRGSESMDRLHAWLVAVGPRGWLVLGMTAVGLSFVNGSAPMEAVAIATGGVLLGYQALRRFVFGLAQLAGAWQAWEMVRDLFDAASHGETGETDLAGGVDASDKVMDVRDVAYAYPGRDRSVLSECSLEIRAGDRVLLEGASGSGKSTFGAILAGLRKPSGGLLLAGGMDRATIGAQGWRRRVATAPQYHENHVMAAPLHFNLLMGRAWPPSPEDIKETLAVCRELGLGPLLERMPAGLGEMVGDTGWQLSQGERSRVFLARAILQGAPLVILDESFAALDPETLEQCLECVLRRAPSLLVIAHP